MRPSAMTPFFSRRSLLQAGAALAAQAGLPPARACEFFGPTLRVTHPWARASMPGDTEALVSMVLDEVSEDDRLVGVETPVAAAADLLVDGRPAPLDLAIPAGRETRLDAEGRQLRLTGLRQPLDVGRAYPLTLHFAKGGPVKASLSIDLQRFA